MKFSLFNLFNRNKSANNNQSGSTGNSAPADSTTTVTAKLDADLKAEGSGMKMETGASVEVGDQFSAESKAYTGVGYDGKLSVGAEQSVKVGNQTAKSEYELSAGKELELKNKNSVSVKEGLVEQTAGVEQAVGFDGEKVTYGVSAEESVKVGTEENYTENTVSNGMKVGSDGSVEHEASQEVKSKTGPVETSAKHTSSTGFGTEEMGNGETGDYVSHSEKMEVGAKAEVADGVKVSHSESVEVSDKVAESENASSEETTVAFSSETRIEVDAEKAGVGAAVAAGAFNTAMAAKEAVMKELTKFSSKSESESEEEEEAEEETQEQEPEEEEPEEKSNEPEKPENEEKSNEPEKPEEQNAEKEAAEKEAAEKEAAEKEAAEKEAAEKEAAEKEAPAEKEASAEEASKEYDYSQGYGY